MEDKYAAQTNFLNAESVISLYRQILEHGAIGESLTREIAEEKYPEPDAALALEVARDISSEMEREADIEPER